jgi:NO-binding membrane sensor protein with MHYT domain
MSGGISMTVGIINMFLIGMHCLSLSNSKFYKKTKVTIPIVLYMIIRLVYSADSIQASPPQKSTFYSYFKICYLSEAQLYVLLSLIFDPLCLLTLV